MLLKEFSTKVSTEKLNENLVKLLENFNNTSAPANKITGQLWFDQTNKQINLTKLNEAKLN